MPPIRVVFSGATGSVGRAVIPALLRHPDFALVGAVGRRGAGEDIGVLLGLVPAGVRLTPDIHAALRGSGAQVLIDYSAPDVSPTFCRAALEAGAAVVLATTGLAPAVVEELGRVAERQGLGLLRAPNLTLAGHLMFRCVELVKRFMGDVEIVEGHPSTKQDAPSGTALETAERINRVPGPDPTRDHTSLGLPEARGARVGEVRIHSLRLPGFVDHQEVIFAAPGQLLSIRLDVVSPEVFIQPTLKAARLVLGVRGLVHDLPGLFEPD